MVSRHLPAREGMTFAGLVARNLVRRPARTALTSIGVAVGVGLIVALLSITAGVRHTAEDLIHVGRADFGLFQGDVSDFSRSELPASLAPTVARDRGVAQIASIKLLVENGLLVFGLEPSQFAYRRLVILSGRRSGLLAGDHSGRRLGDTVTIGGHHFVVAGIYHSGDRFEDLGVVMGLQTVAALSGTPGEITTIGIVAKLGADVQTVAHRLEREHPGVVAVTEPGQAVKVDTSSRLIISTGWIVSLLALIVGGIGVTNTMAMSVFERVSEIGVLRAVGWPTHRIAAMIVLEALDLCLIALAVGCGFGVLGARLFVSHSALSSLITPTFTGGTFAWGLAFALGVALLGAAYPAWRAVRLEPIDALRRR